MKLIHNTILIMKKTITKMMTLDVSRERTMVVQAKF